MAARRRGHGHRRQRHRAGSRRPKLKQVGFSDADFSGRSDSQDPEQALQGADPAMLERYKKYLPNSRQNN